MWKIFNKAHFSIWASYAFGLNWIKQSPQNAVIPNYRFPCASKPKDIWKNL
ncbi:hypothetical protein C943_04423 [Mariniradius saccharolyticus AK6]|uniref:Uncharacterized protein n=1 Tax=Mariniradius saccharolyticus AK6 TaxID=1239962 RepID=M7X817_9BACT|nr:hypothetical protein C943_04423 [Mariniradius saccharolyticus AK6]